MLALDTTKADMAAAPRVKEDRFAGTNDFDKQSQQVDVYWSANRRNEFVTGRPTAPGLAPSRAIESIRLTMLKSE